MKILKSICLASLLATSLAQAAVPCNGFEIAVRNKLADDLIATKIQLSGAVIQPGALQKINAKTAQSFTVNQSVNDIPMVGEFVFRTISLPSKEVKIHFSLVNSKIICEHTDQTPVSDYSVEKTRLPGKVEYVILNK